MLLKRLKKTTKQYVAILACDNKGGIAKNGYIPWYLPNDLKFFKEKTEGNIIIMGRNTFKSLLNKRLKNRSYIVLSSSLKKEDTHEFVIVKNNFNKMLLDINSVDIIDILKITKYVIGGSKILHLFMKKKYINKLYLTIIDDDFDCDTFIKKDVEKFISNKKIKKTLIEKGIQNNLKYKIIEYSYE